MNPTLIRTSWLALVVLLPLSARADDDAAAILLRQKDGTFRAVRPDGSGPYQASPAYPGADFAPVYDSHGRRAGTIVNTPNGPVFEDNKGRRKP